MQRLNVSSNFRLILTYIFLSFILMGADRYGFLTFFRSGVEGLLLPIERGVYGFGLLLGQPLQTLRFWRSGTERITNLERTVAELMVDASKTQQLLEENQAMRKQLSSQLPKSWTLVPCALLGKGDLVSVSVGSEQGIGRGDLVVKDDIVFGIVDEVSGRKSTVQLLTDPKTRLSVYSPRYGAEGVVVGRFGQQVIVSQVLQSEQLQEEDILITSGAVGAPRGLVVGSVARVISDKNDVYQEAIIGQPLNLSELTTVFVLRQKD